MIRVGMKLGKLEVISVTSKNGGFRIVARCECGNIRTGGIGRLKNFKSCGCWERKQHGMTNASEYVAWANMIERCTNPKVKNFVNYGGRGITVCREWMDSFAVFFKHIGAKPDPKMTLDRIENNKGYFPGNVRWATYEQQLQNTRKNVFLEHKGQRLCLREWSRKTGLNHKTIANRIAAGLSSDMCLRPGKFTRTWKKMGGTLLSIAL